jgi:hypothetical protein
MRTEIYGLEGWLQIGLSGKTKIDDGLLFNVVVVVASNPATNDKRIHETRP